MAQKKSIKDSKGKLEPGNNGIRLSIPFYELEYNPRRRFSLELVTRDEIEVY